MVLTQICLKQGSIVNRIQHSSVIGRVFANFVADMDDNLGNVALKNLNFRKHRMESARKPAGRAIIYWDALIMTAEWVIANRTEKGLVDEAVFFLCYIDEETYFRLASYLDGADSAFWRAEIR